MGRTEPLHTMMRCREPNCLRWQSRQMTSEPGNQGQPPGCSVCGGELEIPDMKAHIAALPQAKD